MTGQDRVTLCLADPGGEVFTTSGNPRTGAWDGWTTVSQFSTTPGAPVTAVVTGQNRVALFLADPSGEVFTTSGTIPRQIMRWMINLNPLDCHDEGDGAGDAEPYLWTVFFKCDGSTLSVSDAGRIEGSAVTFPTPGSHGNLHDDDVDAGDTVFIPSELGSFSDSVIPIPVSPLIQPLLGQEDIPGFFGVVVVLMEEDNVTDAGAEAGHHALNTAVQSAIDKVLRLLGAGHTSITPEDIESVTAGIDDAVKDAIREQQNLFENIWSWLNADDQIGNKTFIFNQDQFVTEEFPDQRIGSLGFSERWRNHGDWEIHGAMALTEPCVANTTASILAGQATESAYSVRSSDKFGRELAAMRSFRDNYFHRYEGLHDWWNLAARNTPQLAYLVMREPEMRQSAAVFFKEIEAVLSDLDSPLPVDFLDHAQLAASVARRSHFRRLRLDASRMADALGKLKPGATGNDALKVFTELPPARYPKQKQAG